MLPDAPASAASRARRVRGLVVVGVGVPELAVPALVIGDARPLSRAGARGTRSRSSGAARRGSRTRGRSRGSRRSRATDRVAAPRARSRRSCSRGRRPRASSTPGHPVDSYSGTNENAPIQPERHVDGGDVPTRRGDRHPLEHDPGRRDHPHRGERRHACGAVDRAAARSGCTCPRSAGRSRCGRAGAAGFAVAATSCPRWYSALAPNIADQRGGVDDGAEGRQPGGRGRHQRDRRDQRDEERVEVRRAAVARLGEAASGRVRGRSPAARTRGSRAAVASRAARRAHLGLVGERHATRADHQGHDRGDAPAARRRSAPARAGRGRRPRCRPRSARCSGRGGAREGIRRRRGSDPSSRVVSVPSAGRRRVNRARPGGSRSSRAPRSAGLRGCCRCRGRRRTASGRRGRSGTSFTSTPPKSSSRAARSASGEVAGEDRGLEPVPGVVGEREARRRRRGRSAPRRPGRTPPGVHTFMSGVTFGEHGRREHAVALDVAAGRDLRAAGDRLVDPRRRRGRARRSRSAPRRRWRRRAGRRRRAPRPCGTSCVEERVGDRLVHVDALGRDARLPGVAEPGDRDLRRRGRRRRRRAR